MKFDQDFALKIQKKYDIPYHTVRTWKYKNKIPDKYSKNLITLKEAISESYTRNYLKGRGLEVEKRVKAHLKKSMVRPDYDQQYYRQLLRSYTNMVKKKLEQE